MTENDDVLVRKAQAGDHRAFEALVRRTSRLVFARLYLETEDAHRAEDQLQETLLRAFQSLKQLEAPGQLRAWLLTIAQNVLTDSARRDTRLKRAAPPRAGPGMLALVPGSEPLPEREAQRKEEETRMLAVLRSLPEEYRLPLSLRYLAGADYETIETQLGLSNGALRGLLHRGLKLLRTRLENDHGEQEA